MAGNNQAGGGRGHSEGDGEDGEDAEHDWSSVRRVLRECSELEKLCVNASERLGERETTVRRVLESGLSRTNRD